MSVAGAGGVWLLLMVMAPVATFYEMLDVTRARKEPSRIFLNYGKYVDVILGCRREDHEGWSVLLA